MKKPKLTKSGAIVLLVTLAVALAAIGYTIWQPAEPEYQGKSITLWVDELNSVRGQNELKRQREAKEAIETIGLKGAPYIIRHLKRADSPWRKTYLNLIPKLPSFLRKFLPFPDKEKDASWASTALFFIGPSVKPVLIEALEENGPTVRHASVSALRSLANYHGMEIKEALLGIMDCLQDADAHVRKAAVGALAYMGTDAAPAAPKLIPLLQDPQIGRKKGSVVYVRSGAARTLGKIGPKAIDAIPALKSLLNAANPYDRSIAAIAIWRIDSDVTNTVPVLIQALNLVHENSKWELIEGLGEMGPKAKQAVPSLLSQLTHNGVSGLARVAVTNALLRIDPDAAALAGIKAPTVE